jgi:hypothetical protein
VAATVQIIRKTGVAPGVAANITSINTRANADDINSVASTTNPIKIPAAGTNYSFWVNTRLNVTVTPSGTIDNVKWFTDGTNNFGTGVTCMGAKASTGADAGYREAVGVVAISGTQLTLVNNTGLDAAPVDVFTFTTGAPLALSGSITNPSTGEFGDFMVYQTEIGITATPGPTGAESFFFRYDET